MDVEIVTFPATKLAVIEHLGSPALEHESVKRLVAWRIENHLPPSSTHRNYGIHYNDPNKVPAAEYRVDLGISVEHEVAANPYGVVNKVIPNLLCAKVRHVGSREQVTAAQYLYEHWLPNSGEHLADFPMFFHYINVGPQVKQAAMLTDVYLPITARPQNL